MYQDCKQNIVFFRGAINIHPSLLPRWRGAAPLTHTILSGDKTTGITIMELSTKKYIKSFIIAEKIFFIQLFHKNKEVKEV